MLHAFSLCYAAIFFLGKTMSTTFKYIAIIYAITYAATVYSLTTKGWDLFQALLGAIVAAAVWDCIFVIPIGVILLIYKVINFFNKQMKD